METGSTPDYSAFLYSPAPIRDASPSSNAAMNNDADMMEASTSRAGSSTADYGLDPMAFSNVSFQMPSFLGPAANSDRITYLEADANTSRFLQNGSSIPIVPPSSDLTPMSSYMTSLAARHPAPVKTATSPESSIANAIDKGKGPAISKPTGNYTPNPANPVYAMYGSSVVDINPDVRPFSKLIPEVHGLQALSSSSYQALHGVSADSDNKSKMSKEFDPNAPGLPKTIGGNFPGLYSASGFDMLGVLARVAARPHVQINVGPIDTSASFLVVDARKFDFPIVFASETFTKLTGYSNAEVVGKNCRFLQAPGGNVSMGEKRTATDGDAVWHMKTHILAAKETQTSLLNYKKDGTPFINLITIIPITWDTDEIAYYVGFQVDLVDQPNAILEKMQNGTYTVNYTLMPRSNLDTSSMTAFPSSSNQLSLEEDMNRVRAEAQGVPGDFGESHETKPSASTSKQSSAPAEETVVSDEFERLCLQHCDDLIVAVNAKGNFLYVSPASAKLLGYEPSDLISQHLSMLCHPSDLVPVARELKEATSSHGNISHTLQLLFRAKRKNSGYVWMEANGRVTKDKKQSRKNVVMSIRQRSTYHLDWKSINEHSNGLGELEFWSKVSSNGLCIYVTPTVKNVLGFSSEDLMGTSLKQLSADQTYNEIDQAIEKALRGEICSLRHTLRNRRSTAVDCFTVFYPNSSSSDSLPATHRTVLLQTNEWSSAQQSRNRTSKASSKSNSMPVSPVLPVSPTKERSGSLFEELATSHATSWQYELHQLKIANKGLHEEIAHLEAARLHRQASKPTQLLSRPQCANCGGDEVQDLHRGPGGKANLCHTCGKRWQEAMSSKSADIEMA